MVIAFVTPEFVTEPSSYDGGLSNYLFRVSLSLQRLGHTPIIIVENRETEEVLMHQGIEVHRVKVSYKGISFRLWKLVNKFRVIQGAEEWMYSSYMLNRYLFKIQKRKVIDIIQYASYRATGYYRLKNKAAVVRISSYEPLYQQEKGQGINHALVKAEAEAFLKADSVFGPSKLVGKMIEDDLNVEIRIIETPFELDVEKQDYDYSIYEELQPKKYLLYWGSLGTIKGVDLILDIIPSLLTAHSDLMFAFIGKHVDRVAEFEKIKEKYPDNIFIHTPIPHAQLYPIIANAYAAVLPSRADNFPNTCIEGMAFGKVVIGTRETSFEQLIEDGVSGILCKKDDPNDLLVAVEKVLGMSDEQRKKIGDHAKKRIEQLSPEKVVVELIEFYQAVINSFNENKHA